MTNSHLSLAELIEQSCDLLKEHKILFALSGGIAADIYRNEPRATDDVDFVVAIDETDIEKGSKIISALGYTPSITTEEMLRGDTRFSRKAKKGEPRLLVGRAPEKPYGIDFLLLTFPWAKNALERAQSNSIDLGFGFVPCLTVEDLIISKLYAIKQSSIRRYKKSDIPDIALMLEHNSDIDLNYLTDVMTTLELVLPKGIEQDAHYLLSRISRKNRKKDKAIDY